MTDHEGEEGSSKPTAELALRLHSSSIGVIETGGIFHSFLPQLRVAGKAQYVSDPLGAVLVMCLVTLLKLEHSVPDAVTGVLCAVSNWWLGAGQWSASVCPAVVTPGPGWL